MCARLQRRRVVPAPGGAVHRAPLCGERGRQARAASAPLLRGLLAGGRAAPASRAAAASPGAAPGPLPAPAPPSPRPEPGSRWPAAAGLAGAALRGRVSPRPGTSGSGSPQTVGADRASPRPLSPQPLALPGRAAPSVQGARRVCWGEVPARGRSFPALAGCRCPLPARGRGREPGAPKREAPPQPAVGSRQSQAVCAGIGPRRQGVLSPSVRAPPAPRPRATPSPSAWRPLVVLAVGQGESWLGSGGLSWARGTRVPGAPRLSVRWPPYQ